MNSQVNYITKVLCDNGYKVHIVGGAVRDILLGKDPSDYDLVTNATIEEIIPLFPNDKVDSVGASFNVLIVNNIEIASYRIDQYTDNFELTFCNQAVTLEEDLSRRDFTINAMAICPSGNITDLFDGRNDLNNRTIRFIGNPEDRIKEDPCRILRACRFAAKIDGQIEILSSAVIRCNNHLFNDIAKERVRLEIVKAMDCKIASTFFEELRSNELLDKIFLSLFNCYALNGGRYHGETVFEHCLLSGDVISTKYPLLKIATYLHDIGKFYTQAVNEDGHLSFIEHEKVGTEIIRNELFNLKFSTEEIEYICGIVSLHMRTIRGASPKAIRRLLVDLNKLGISYKDLIRLRIADRKGNKLKEPHNISEIKHMLNKFQTELNRKEEPVFGIKDLKINGVDVMMILGIQPGKEVGRILKQLFESVIDNPELNELDTLIKIVKEIG